MFFEDHDKEHEIMDLFEIADLLYHAKNQTAMKLFHPLSQESKQCFNNHMHILNGNFTDLTADRMKSIQALIATAHEISDSDIGDGYMSLEEIDTMYQELDPIKRPLA